MKHLSVFKFNIFLNMCITDLMSEHVQAVEWEKTALQELDITATDLSTECLMDLLVRVPALRWLSAGQQDGFNDAVTKFSYYISIINSTSTIVELTAIISRIKYNFRMFNFFKGITSFLRTGQRKTSRCLGFGCFGQSLRGSSI